MEPLKLQAGWSTKASYKSSAMPSRQDSPILPKNKSEMPFGMLEQNNIKILRSQTHTEGSQKGPGKRDVIHLAPVAGSEPFSFGEVQTAQNDLALKHHLSAPFSGGMKASSREIKSGDHNKNPAKLKDPRSSVFTKSNTRLNVSMSSDGTQSGPQKPTTGSFGQTQILTSDESLKKLGGPEDEARKKPVPDILKELEVRFALTAGEGVQRASPTSRAAEVPEV